MTCAEKLLWHFMCFILQVVKKAIGVMSGLPYNVMLAFAFPTKYINNNYCCIFWMSITRLMHWCTHNCNRAANCYVRFYKNTVVLFIHYKIIYVIIVALSVLLQYDMIKFIQKCRRDKKRISQRAFELLRHRVFGSFTYFDLHLYSGFLVL